MQLLHVPATTGWRWVGSGLQWLRRQPLRALGLVGLYTLLVAALSGIPVIGGILPLLVLQIATLGFNHAARAIDLGQPLRPGMLLAGLRAPAARRRQLLLLCLLYCGGVVAVLLASSVLDGGTLLRLALFSDISPEQALAQLEPLRAAAMLAALLYLPLAAAFWFAPLLICWHGMGAWQALFSSSLIVLRNLPAFLLYMLSWLALFATLPTLVALAAGALGADQQSAALAGLPVALLLFVAFVLSFYASARSLLPAADASAAA